MSIAAASLLLAPKVIYHNKNIQVIEFLKSKTLNDKDVRERINDIIPLIKKVHKDIPKNLMGNQLSFGFSMSLDIMQIF